MGEAHLNPGGYEHIGIDIECLEQVTAIGGTSWTGCFWNNRAGGFVVFLFSFSGCLLALSMLGRCVPSGHDSGLSRQVPSAGASPAGLGVLGQSGMGTTARPRWEYSTGIRCDRANNGVDETRTDIGEQNARCFEQAVCWNMATDANRIAYCLPGFCVTADATILVSSLGL